MELVLRHEARDEKVVPHSFSTNYWSLLNSTLYHAEFIEEAGLSTARVKTKVNFYPPKLCWIMSYVVLVTTSDAWSPVHSEKFL